MRALGARPPLRAYLAPPSVAACVAVTTRRTLCVFDVATGQRRYCSARGEAYTALAQLGSSSLIIVVPRTMPRCVRLINTTDGAVLRQINCRTAVLAVHVDRERLVVRLRTEVHVFALDTLERITTVEVSAASSGLAIGSKVVALPSARDVGSVDILEAASLRLLSVIAAHKTDIACLALSADGALLATASTRGTVIRVWALADASKVASFRRGRTQARIATMRFSDDARYLCVGSESATIHVFAVGGDASKVASRSRAVVCLQAEPGCAACSFCAVRPEDAGNPRRQRLCVVSTRGDLALFTLTEPSAPGAPFSARLDAEHQLDFVVGPRD